MGIIDIFANKLLTIMIKSNFKIILIGLILVLFSSCNNDNSISQNKSTIDSTTDEIYNDTIKSKLYTFVSNETYINENSSSLIYIGSVIYNEAKDLSSIKAPSGLKYNEIEYGALYNKELYFTKSEPSLSETNKIFQKIKSSTALQNASFIYSSPITFHNHKELHFLGMKNTGLQLDSIFSNLKYNSCDMEYKNGLIYKYYNEVATITMDYPTNGIIKNNYITTDKDKMAYVNSITYGRVSYMILEFNSNNDLIKNIVKKMYKGEKLSEEETKSISQVAVCILRFDDNMHPKITKGNSELISDFYKNSISTSITHITFSALSIKDNSNYGITFHVDMR